MQNSCKKTGTKPTYISLYAGCGGFDVGFANSGYESLGAFDIDPLALRNLHTNIGSPVYQCDLSKEVLPARLDQSPEVVISGSPCQGFSTIGKRDVDDFRNRLLLSGARVALKLKPKVFLAENVPGVVSGKHKKYWEELQYVMAQEGYNIKEMKVDAYDFGVPQHRERMLLFAWRRNCTLGDLSKGKKSTLKEAFKGVRWLKNHNVELLDEDSREYKIASRIKQGEKLSNVRGGCRSVHTWDIPEVFGEVTKQERLLLTEMISLRRRHRLRNFGDADPVERRLLEAMFSRPLVKSLLRKNYLEEIGNSVDLVGRFNGKFRRLSLEGPSYTVDTRFGLAKNFLHPSQHRGMTVREAARIQGFSDDYVFTGSDSDQYKMIGNAVPPPMSYALAKFIQKRLLSN
ncbi:MAG: DNA cytosine methyltransferase [Candidatus Dadabacteria bacterium]|nr:DNA cytosine methyltransferase [Candidatus Dadabacteria bacterium]